MPRLTQTAEVQAPTVQFVVSEPLDMLNAMYFTSLAADQEGVDGWPVQLRREMAPGLLAELDFLFNYPAGNPGFLGMLCDNLVVHPEAWSDIDSLVRYVRGLPDGIGELAHTPGIQGLIYDVTFHYLDEPDRAPYEGLPPREAIERRLLSLDDRDAAAIMPYYDRPAELRERMVRLIEGFYYDHYAEEAPKRIPAMERSAAAHRNEGPSEPAQLARKLSGRTTTCLEGVCAGDWARHVFIPSLDMGAYNSCTVIDGVHGLYYPLEPEFAGTPPAEAEEVRLARVYKALGDEQRLRILKMLREREMYAQEVVERTGLHQSVVSRHLSFMKAVGLLTVRKHNNMKFFSLNPEMRDQLARTIALFSPNPTKEVR